MQQSFTDFELVISDNWSDDQTKSILDGIKDPRVKKFKPPHLMAMTDHFEFALSNACGKFVIFIGADDGMYSWSLEYLNAAISHYNKECYDWNPVTFIWPDKCEAMFYVNFKDFLNTTHVETSKEAFDRLSSPSKVSQPLLTGFNIYHGLVSMALIERVKASNSGRYFDGLSPDLCSAIDNLFHADASVKLGQPASITGLSRLSTGWAHMIPEPSAEQKKIVKEFDQLKNRSTSDSDIPLLTARCTVAGYLSAFFEGWRKYKKDLTKFPHEPWRQLYIQEIGLHYADTAQLRCDEYNAFARFLRSKDVLDAKDIVLAECEASQKAQGKISGASKASAASIQIIPEQLVKLSSAKSFQSPFVNRFASVGLFQWQGALMVDCKVRGENFTIRDFSTVMEYFVPIDINNFTDTGQLELGRLESAAKRRCALYMKWLADSAASGSRSQSKAVA